MLKTARIRITSTVLLALAAMSLMFMIASTSLLVTAEDDVRRAWAERYSSYLLADELRQSSDDLTRLGRTYVLTGDARYESQYMDILAIRNGQKERPEGYHRIYWDFAAADRPTTGGSGETRALADLMKEAGFTDVEFALLAKAQANSDGLVGLEVRAMNAVKGIFADESGNYTVNGTPDPELAANLLHSPEYHNFKADIMAPVNDFLIAMEARFDRRIEQLEASADAARRNINMAAGLLSLSLAALSLLLVVMILRPLSKLITTMANHAAGTAIVDVPCSHQTDEFGILAREIGASIGSADANRAMVIEVSNLAEAAGQGRFDLRIAPVQDRDDLNHIAAGLNTMMDNLDSAFTAILHVMAGLAQGDLTRTIDLQLSGRLGEVLSNAQTARSGLAALIHQSRGGTNSLGARTSDLSAAIEQLQRRTETSAAALEQTSAALTLLTASVREASQNAAEADTVAGGARNVAAQGLAAMKEVTVAMNDIAKSSKEITTIVEVIDSIAFQTNLLALNARVEAARAGDAGKGFAVVASEVSTLSIRVSESTGSISDLVEKSGQQVAHGAELIGRAASTIGDVTRAISQISEFVSVVAASMKEQSVGLAEISHAIEELDRNTVQNSKMAAEASFGTEELRELAQSISMGMDQFQLDDAPAAHPDSHLRRAS
jgi:methyl-accepting chemotaxis protein